MLSSAACLISSRVSSSVTLHSMEDQSPKPIRCKAAVCRAAGEPLVVEEIVVDPPKEYEIRIKIVCTSLCHSDITFWRAKVATSFPRILGHEAYGVVESVGEHVEGFAAGDTVVPTFLGQCDHCPGCASEHNNLCTTVPFVFGPGMRRDGTTRFRDAHGNPLHDLVAVSSFSEYTVVDVTQVVKIDPAVPPKLACLLSCGASTGVGAAWRVAKVQPGSSVVIFGLGSVGLAVAQGAKMCGASKIIGVDMNPDKEEVGKSFGVTHFVNPSQLGNSSVTEEIAKLTGGGADYSFECIGVSSVMTDAFTSTKPGKGKTIILGLEKDNEPISLPSLDLLSGKCIMGSYFGGLKPKTDVPTLARKCMNKELELDGLVTHEVGLQEINTAFDLLLQGKSLRCIIWMDKDK
ncbi:alcohol dehydrogenase-like 2 [Panicum miliaceum]|uniref:Alcohol dehydrogenase-like 2 n=1 Tax=Panicum miliaceum TaxID=4540 RepID=A0A3L6SFR4_PANMI|nr:alcohol dehydrogenase-like 2 [Panicum miliaceum]